QKKIPRLAPAQARLAPPGYAQALAFGDTGRNLDLISLALRHLASAAADVAKVTSALAGAAAVFARDAAPDGDRADRAAHRFLQGDHDVAFDVAPAFGCEVL